MITLEERVSINYKELIKELLTCGMCYNAYDQALHSPKLLRCGHTSCEACLDEYTNHASPGVSRSFSCPMCREENEIKIGFKADFRTNQLLDLINRQGREVIPRCSDHPSQELFFCEPCDTLFCSLCDNISHDNQKSNSQEHKVILSSVIIKRDTGALSHKANQCIMNLEEAHESVASEIEMLGYNAKRVEADIDESFEMMRKLMEDRKEELVASAKRIHEDKLEILETQLRMIEKEKTKVENEYKGFKFQGDMADITNKMKELNAITESVASLLKPREKCSMHFDIKGSITDDVIRNHGTVRPN